MADRRTTVVIDVQVGDIILPTGQIKIPATVDLNAGSSKTEAQKSAGNLAKTIEKALSGLVGSAWARQIPWARHW